MSEGPAGAPAVADLSRAHDLEVRLAPYAAQRWQRPRPDHPTLHLEDVSAIPFLTDIAGVEEYQHRARVRAAHGDLYATVTPPAAGYETYCADHLTLGAPGHLPLTPGADRLAVAEACLDDAPLATLVETARRHEGLVLHPYMSIEPVWTLAATVARESGQPVQVMGPPPPVTWIANDKHAFDQLVEAVLGPGWTTETHSTADPGVLATTLLDLAARHDRVGLKRTRCASAMGNLVLDSAGLRSCAEAEVGATVDAFLSRTDWPGDEVVLAVAWENASSSPSTQWWLPPARFGPPRLDGIYEQILEGERQVFVGSRPSGLPREVHTRLTKAAGAVAAALQDLGYVGRCSFDHLVVGDPASAPRLLFTECNGRWGGTSTPMHLVDRVVRGARPPYRAQDLSHPGLRGVPFAEIRERLGETLFDPRRQTGRYLLYNVGPLADHGKLDVVAVGMTQDDAEAAIVEELPRRLAL